MRAQRRVGTVPVLTLVLLLLLGACTPPGLPAPQSPSAPASAASSAPAVEQVVVGVDGAVSGFNPHAIADFSPAARAVASLVLPSATVVHPDGTTGFDPAVVDNAVVTSTTPFVVTYTLNRAAAWSDGTPVTAEDFAFLRDQMLAQPGTVDPAGYRMITAIRSRNAGKTVDVEFAGPFPDWPTLFSPLLPAHILKDAPGGWTDGLDGGIPVSANRYKMTSFDAVTGEITLVRNDKYWADNFGPATVVLRIGSPEELLAALQRGDVQAVFGQPDGAIAADIDAVVPADRRARVPLPATVQLIFNTTSGGTSDPAVRTAVATTLDLDRLRNTLSGGRPGGMLPVGSMVSLPAKAKGRPVTPPLAAMNDPAKARELLAAAGYDVGGLYVRQGQTVLRLTLGFPTRDARMAAAAREIQRELGRAGIEVNLLADAAGPLITARAATGALDLLLVTVPRSRSDAVATGSGFGCAQVAARRTGNLSGYCSAPVEAAITAALAGVGDLGPTDSRLWSDLPILPIGEPTAILAVGPSLQRATIGNGDGWLWSGPLQGLPQWSDR